MKTRKPKSGSLVMAVLMVLCGTLVLIGCKGKSQSGGKTELLVYMPPFATGGDVFDLNFWQKTVEPWAKEKNVTVSFEIVPWEQIGEKYLAAFSSDTGPDIAYNYIDGIRRYMEMGVVEPLDSYFTQAEKDNYLFWDMGRLDGKQYALPYVVGNARVLFFNMDLVNKAGVTALPKTWAEFVDFGQKVAAAYKGTDILPFIQIWNADAWGEGSMNMGILTNLWQAGGDLFTADNKNVALLDNDAAERTFQWYYDLMHKHNITSQESFSIPGDQHIRLFKEGKLACVLMQSQMAGQLTDVSFEWDFVDSLEDKTKAIWIAADLLFMNSGSKDKNLAAELMKFMSSPAVKESFHRELALFIPISKNEEYLDTPRFRDMYLNSKFFKPNPSALTFGPVSTTFYKNLQLMMLGQISVQEALQRTVDYSKTL
jgi:multiple sugar transport system substrate-binding protein